MRRFLLTVHEADALVLENLRTRERVRVADVGELAERLGAWLAEPEPPVSADTPGWTGSTSAPGPLL
jgi:hypothetical protein